MRQVITKLRKQRRVQAAIKAIKAKAALPKLTVKSKNLIQ